MPLPLGLLRSDVRWIVNGRILREMTLVEAMRTAVALKTGEELDFRPVVHEDRLFVDIGAAAEIENRQPSTSIGRVNMGGTEYAAEPLGTTGATLTSIEPGQKCKYHRLHIAFFECGQDAEFLLTKPDGKTVPLCAAHAKDMRLRHDDSSVDHPREDESYGHPAGPFDFSTPLVDDNPITPDLLPQTPIETAPAFETAAFDAGTSGGGGGGASFEASPVDSTFTESTSSDSSSSDYSSSDSGSSDSGSSDSSSSDSGSSSGD